MLKISVENIFLGHLKCGTKPNMAIFLSGGGSNAKKLLEDKEVLASTNPVVLVTDAPNKSGAQAIGAKHNLPVVALDLRDFYRQHGLETISLATPVGRQVRELWTERLREMLKPYQIDFAVLAGFEPLSNITSDYPCLNIHPGDLSVTDAQGQRCYVGLHSKSVERALLSGEKKLRASVIIALPFKDAAKDMDNGVLLSISQPMTIDHKGMTLESMQAVESRRQGRKPAGGWQDELEMLASELQDKLKIAGDHIVLPLTVRDFARQCFALVNDQLFYRKSASEPFQAVKHVEYDQNGIAIQP